MSPSPGMDAMRRQLWNRPTTTTDSASIQCTPYTLPSNGVLSLVDSAITLTTNVVFQPECTGAWSGGSLDHPSSIADLKDPFYASTTPQTYVIAAATVIAWILVIMLTITPRTSFFGRSVTQPGLGSGHGIIGGANGGNSSLIGVGSRPWLQKVAALTVAISLTIATADAFRVLEQQYDQGYMDATLMREKIMGSKEIKITRVISDVFLWLAQVQTLIRLFPRHKEKVLIKWIGFALIVCDSTFSCLNSFMASTTETTKPRHFVDAIPALSYLFELALGLLYAAWVIYYAMAKRRYAFYHAKMRSICLIAMLSLVAILTPVVFFVTDVSNSDVAGWGDYFRWVGAAAASVVVWEWVERIEALEGDEKKDGILGREIFDGDDMLDHNSGHDIVWTSGRGRLGRIRRRGDNENDGHGGSMQPSALEKGLSGFVARFRREQPEAPKHFPLGRAHSHMTEAATDSTGREARRPQGIAFGHLPKRSDERRLAPGITPPPAAASPVSRADTTSAASTMYVVRYDNGPDVAQPIRRRVNNAVKPAEKPEDAQKERAAVPRDPEKEHVEEEEDEAKPNVDRQQQSLWHSVHNPFKRKRTLPPAEVRKAREEAIANGTRAATPAHNFSKWDLKNRLGVLAAETGERLHDRRDRRRQDVDLPVTVIPAQPRGSGRTWSPELMAHQQQAHRQDYVAAGALQSDEPSPTGVSNSTTMTANSIPAAQAVRRSPIFPNPRRRSSTPNVIPARNRPPYSRTNTQQSLTCRSPQEPPPSADELSRAAGSAGPIVVPAPKRSPLRAVTTPQEEFQPSFSSRHSP